MTMIGLIDCNNFFVSCERVFQPRLIGKPVIVLSSNDGCAVAMSNEAKALGITRGVPFFKIKHIVERCGVEVRSCNHMLYGNMSGRIMNLLRMIADDIEIYSIDEAFIHFPHDLNDSYSDFGQYIVRKIRRDTGIPTSMGVAPTKTLAKLAGRFAKHYAGYRGVCVIDSPDKARKAMSMTAVEDVWGVGRRMAPKLHDRGITTALHLAELDGERVRHLMGLGGERTWRELNGEACITQEFIDPHRRSISASRSFATDITNINLIKQAISSFASTVSRKLRKEQCYATEVSVFIATNRFNANMPQYVNSAASRFDDPTNDTAVIANEALKNLTRIFRHEYGYKKAGITISGLVPEGELQLGLFTDHALHEKRNRLMQVIDSINSQSADRERVCLAATGDGLASLTRHANVTNPVIIINCK